MSRKMKIEKTLENLRKLNEAAKKEVELLEFELAETQEHLNAAKEREITTADAIAALTGAPTLKKMLEEAIKPKHAAPAREIEMIPSSNLPSPEPGFKWAVNELGEDVLIAQNAEIAASQILSLPEVLENENFADKPEDLI